ncbi:hypothetical protein ORS3428_14565 [Mesorhizobium sp. ORS 3428]|nr:hypothetical protein ORS3428_14565 [Mesorhizobium sp. ORS 3428]
MLKPASGLEWRHGFLIQATWLMHTERAPKGALFAWQLQSVSKGGQSFVPLWLAKACATANLPSNGDA